MMAYLDLAKGLVEALRPILRADEILRNFKPVEYFGTGMQQYVTELVFALVSEGCADRVRAWRESCYGQMENTGGK